MDAPLYEHDCTNCVYLGRHNNLDLYYCKGVRRETVIARRSSLGHDYQSGIIFATQRLVPDLVEALVRAKAAGLTETKFTIPPIF